jgi:Leucine-rich repeat (LRR) protein
MKRSLRTPIITSLLVALALPVLANLPTELQGTWILDEAATMVAVKKSPKWDAEAEEMMPSMLKFMALMSMSFTETTMTQGSGGKQVTLTPTMISSDGGKHVFSATHRDKTITFTARTNSKSQLNLRADASDDMDFIIWKRGTVTADARKSETDAIAGLVQTALQEGLKPGRKPAATTPAPLPTAEKPTKDYEIKRRRLVIHALPESAIAPLNAIPIEERKRVMITKSCSQEDFTRLSQITGIEELTIDGNKQLSSLHPIAALSTLKSLKLHRLTANGGTPLDLTPLAALTALEAIDCMVTQVTHTEALGKLTQLKTVKLYMSAVSSIEFLRTTPLVEELDLYGFKHTFKDYAPLLTLPNLKRLNIYMNTTARDELLAPLAAMTTLEQISMSNCRKLTTLAFLQGSKGLTKLDAAWGRKLVDISAIIDKAALRDIDLKDSAITDFSPLRNKPELRFLELSGTAFADLTLLAASTQLTSLTIHKSQVKDITPLSTFSNLRRLSVSKETPDTQIAALQKALPNLSIRKK